jgi:hypothetical protein
MEGVHVFDWSHAVRDFTDTEAIFSFPAREVDGLSLCAMLRRESTAP